MRVLFTTQPALGHFHPLVPLAQALIAAGHDVAVACAESFCPTVEASGLQAFPAGIDWLAEETLAAFPEFAALPPDVDRTAWFWRNIFAGRTAERMVGDLLTVAESWNPDLIVRETAEHGGCLVAECLGLPHAVIQSGNLGPGLSAWVGPPLNALRAEWS